MWHYDGQHGGEEEEEEEHGGDSRLSVVLSFGD